MLHKLIVRLDYERVAFKVIDRVGELCDRLINLPDVKVKAGDEGKFFRELQENIASRQYVGRRVRDGEAVILQFTPTFLACTWEFVDGLSFQDFGRDERVQRMLRFAYEFLTEFKITRFARLGIRLVWLDSVGSAHGAAQCRRQLNSQLLGVIENGLGSAQDFGFAIDGCSDDGIKYHCKFGPYEANREAERAFEQIGAAMAGEEKGNFVFDLDLYEEKVTLLVNPSKWAGPLVEKAQRTIQGLLKELQSEDANVKSTRINIR